MSDRSGATASSGVVIGGGSGIGRAIALERAGRGSRVVVADLDLGAAESVAREDLALAGELMAAVADVRELTTLDALVLKAVDWLGAVDFLVVTAGRTQSGTLLESDPGQWAGILDTNLLGTANALRAFGPALGATRGHAVVVASLSGREIYIGQPIYIATKWGVIGLAHSVRREWRESGVRVTVVAPGLVDTPMARTNPHAAELLQTVAPLAPEDVAASVGFVLDQPPNVLIREIQIQPLQQDL